MKDDLVSKMIEKLDKREVLCGFNHNNTREVDEGKFDIGVNIKR